MQAPVEFLRAELGRIKTWLIVATLVGGFALYTMHQQKSEIKVLRLKVDKLERYVSSVKDRLNHLEGE